MKYLGFVYGTSTLQPIMNFKLDLYRSLHGDNYQFIITTVLLFGRCNLAEGFVHITKEVRDDNIHMQFNSMTVQLYIAMSILM